MKDVGIKMSNIYQGSFVVVINTLLLFSVSVVFGNSDTISIQGLCGDKSINEIFVESIKNRVNSAEELNNSIIMISNRNLQECQPHKVTRSIRSAIRKSYKEAIQNRKMVNGLLIGDVARYNGKWNAEIELLQQNGYGTEFKISFNGVDSFDTLVDEVSNELINRLTNWQNQKRNLKTDSIEDYTSKQSGFRFIKSASMGLASAPEFGVGINLGVQWKYFIISTGVGYGNIMAYSFFPQYLTPVLKFGLQYGRHTLAASECRLYGEDRSPEFDIFGLEYNFDIGKPRGVGVNIGVIYKYGESEAGLEYFAPILALTSEF